MYVDLDSLKKCLTAEIFGSVNCLELIIVYNNVNDKIISFWLPSPLLAYIR